MDKGIAEFHRKQMHMDIEHQDREWRKLNVVENDNTMRWIVAVVLVLAVIAFEICIHRSEPKEKTVITHPVSGNTENTMD